MKLRFLAGDYLLGCLHPMVQHFSTSWIPEKRWKIN